MNTREFSLGAVLSVTTGCLMCKMEDVYEILNWMTGDSLFTHQLPRAADECRAPLLEQHPQLKDIDTKDITRDNVIQRLAELQGQYGATLAVAPLAEGGHRYIDPVTEAMEMFGSDRVIPVTVANHE